MGVKATAIKIILSIITCAAVASLAGGAAFLERPFGAAYILLLFMWLATLTGRRAGVPSDYDRSQRGIYSLLALIYTAVLLAAPWEYSHFSGPIPRDGPLAWVGLAILAIGIAIRTAAIRELHGLYTQRLGIQEGHLLVQTGPYHLVRHPGYSGEIMAVFGISLALSSLIGLTATAFLVPLLIRRMDVEDKMLLEEFGDQFRAYASKTKRLVPYIY